MVLVSLTERESVVLAGLADSMSMEQLAQSLYVSRNTLKSHTRSLYLKLGAHSREEALARARQLGLL
ncbi:response regulator transcription factor [Nocardioides sp.]|uniref:response regulator transcription factor n=1 Tax=Nocardioides sp. TaxID=35761 RepID=UPI0039E456A7